MHGYSIGRLSLDGVLRHDDHGNEEHDQDFAEMPVFYVTGCRDNDSLDMESVALDS